MQSIGGLFAQSMAPASQVMNGISGVSFQALDGNKKATYSNYSKPKMVSVGGAAANTLTGYAVTGNNTSYVYADVVASGRVYWEASKGSGEMINFLSASPGTAFSNGGFSTSNAGHTTNGFFYSQWGTPAANPPAVTTERCGYAYDAITKTFSVYFNNVLKGSWVLTGAPSNLYACFGFGPSGSSSTVFFGVAGCQYQPPLGYGYL